MTVVPSEIEIRTYLAATDTATEAIRPPTQWARMPQASTTPITQNPGTVDWKSGPLTSGVTRMVMTVTARSVTRSGGRRSAGWS